MMEELKFKCFNCNLSSSFTTRAEDREKIERAFPDGKTTGEVSFICVHCGTANMIQLSLETATSLLARLSSDDPQIQNAIDRARQGDFSSAIDIARRKIGFKL